MASDHLRPNRWLILTGGGLFFLGVAVLVGRFAGIRALVTVTPDGAPMAFPTAVAFTVCGLTFLAHAIGRLRLALAGGIVTAAMGLGVLGVYFLVEPLGLWNLPYDPGLFARGVRFDGRMSPNTAACFAFVGLMLGELTKARPSSRVLLGMGSVVMAISFMALYGHITGLRATYSWWRYTGMALHTAVGFLAAAAAVFAWALRRVPAQKQAAVLALPVFATAGSIVAVVGITAYVSNGQQEESARWVDQTHEVIESMNYAELCLTRMESAMRAFAHSPRKELVAQYEDLSCRLRVEMFHLRFLVENNPPRAEQWQTLEQLIAVKKSAMRQAMAAGAPEDTELMAKVRALVNEMEKQERAVLVVRQAEMARSTEQTNRIVLLGNVVALGLFFLALRITRHAGRAQLVAEEAVRESEERFRSAFEFAGIGMAIVGLHGRWVRVNQAICDIVGYSQAELLNKTFQDITHPDDLQADLGHVQDLIVGRGHHYQMEKRYFHRDGHVVWVRLTVSLVRNTAGAPVHFISQIENITQQKQVAQALSVSEERFRTFAELAPVGIYQTDLAGACVYVNPAWSALAGLGLEAAKGDGWTQALHSEDRAALFVAWQAFVSGEKPFRHEYRFQRPDGTPVWVAGAAVRLQGLTGPVTGYIGTVMDISTPKQLEKDLALARDQALESSRQKSEFLANMSHEIRTPMNGVIGMSTLLMESGLTTEQQDLARIIQGSADSLLTIINDILDFSKIEAGKLRIEPESLELKPLVEETLSLLAPRAHEKRIELVCDFDPRLNLALLGDGGRIRQVLLNLAGNAVKFTEKGEVVVALHWIREHDGRVAFRCEVRDTGIGIPPAAQHLLFQPFSQADGSTTRRFGGTGLGLAISRQIVELMGGEVGFESQEGKGSTFWFELSLPPGAGDPSPLAEVPTSLRVLVVDDNATNRRVTIGQLAGMGIKADAVENAAEGLALLRSGMKLASPYGLALLDWHMPGVDGVGLALEIRKDPLIAETPLVMLSSANQTLDSATLERVRFAALLTKPVRENQLHRALLQALGLSKRVAPAATENPPPQTPGRRFLLVEDNLTNQIVARKILEKMGHTCDIAGNGLAALRMLAQRGYDAILMDCQMPEMDGYTATKKIRAGEVPGLDVRIPIIALTAYAMPSDRQKCLAAGMDEYVAKPLRIEELREALLHCGVQSSVGPTDVVVTVTATGSPLDERQLAQLRGLPGKQYPTLLQDLVEIFLADIPHQLARLHAAAEQDQPAELARLAHKLAGACANLGAEPMRTAALAIEHSTGEREAWPTRLALMDREWARLKLALQDRARTPTL